MPFTTARDAVVRTLGRGKGNPRLAPATLQSILETRALLELASLPFYLPLLDLAPKGDGHPVLLVPGFTTGDGAMIVLKSYLARQGYHVETWGFGRNVGFQRKFVEALEAKVRFLHHRHRRKVSLVGWSLGGSFSLYAAHRAPQCIRNVVTLGSPVTVDPEGKVAPHYVHLLYRLLGHPMGPVAHAARALRFNSLSVPPSVPISAIYSRTDAIVPPHAAMLEDTRGSRENIRVPGSHIGLGFNALVLWIVADRLAQTEGRWRRFKPTGVMRCAYKAGVALPLT